MASFPSFYFSPTLPASSPSKPVLGRGVLCWHDRIARPVEVRAHSRPTRPQLHAAPNSFSHRRVRITPPRCIYDRGPTRTLRLAATVPPPYSRPHTIATARWPSKAWKCLLFAASPPRKAAAALCATPAIMALTLVGRYVRVRWVR